MGSEESVVVCGCIHWNVQGCSDRS